MINDLSYSLNRLSDQSVEDYGNQNKIFEIDKQIKQLIHRRDQYFRNELEKTYDVFSIISNDFINNNVEHTSSTLTDSHQNEPKAELKKIPNNETDFQKAVKENRTQRIALLGVVEKSENDFFK